MIIYKTYHGSGATYSLSYRELRERVQEFVDMTDEKFLESLPEAAHLACIVSWVKELGIDETVGDEGVVHHRSRARARCLHARARILLKSSLNRWRSTVVGQVMRCMITSSLSSLLSSSTAQERV